MKNIQEELNLIINKIIEKKYFEEEYSFHTLTFNIEKIKTIENIKKIYENYINEIKNFEEKKSIVFISSYEISEYDNLHVHLLINKKINDKNHNYLMKYWNDKNGWECLDKRGIIIKNNEEKIFNKERKLEDILLYLTNGLNIIMNYIKIYYIMYPSYTFKGWSEDKLLIKMVEKLYELGKSVLLDRYDIYNPYKEEVKNMNLKNLYEIWCSSVLEKENMELNKLKEYIYSFNKKKDNNFLNLQIKIEEFMKKSKYEIEENMLNDSTTEGFHKNKKIFNEELEKRLYDGEITLLWKYLFKKEKVYYYVLDCIAKAITIGKKKSKIQDENKGEVTDDLIEGIEYHRLDYFIKNLRISEPLFKTLLKNIMKSNIFEYELVEYYINYNMNNANDNLNLIHYIENNERKIEKSIVDFLKDKTIYGYNILKISMLLYKNNQNDWEILLMQYIYIIIEALKASNYIKYDDLVFEKEKNEIKSKYYFTLNEKILESLIKNYKINNYILPQVIMPKEYKWKEDPMNIKGGYDKYIGGLNLLLYENNNLKYKITRKRLEIINKIQKIPLSINRIYLNYLFQSDINILENYLELEFKWFSEYIFDETKSKLRSIPDLFMVLEFMEALYIAKMFKNFDKIWIPIKIDKRGRKYTQGYPLSFMGNRVLRDLFIINREKEREEYDNIISERIKNYYIYINYINKYGEKKMWYNLYNLLINPLTSIVGFDATSQVFQILGGLVLDINLLNYTKVLKSKNLEFKGLYEYILDGIQNDLIDKNSIFYQELIDIVEKYNTQLIFSRRKRKLFVTKEDFLNSIKKSIDRDYIKNILMTYGYNKSFPALVDTTFEYIFKATQASTKYNYKTLKEIAQVIVKNLLSNFDNKFPMLKELKNIFTKLSILGNITKEGVYINYKKELSEAGTGFIQSYYLEEYVSIHKKMYVKDIKSRSGKRYTKDIYVTFLKEYYDNIEEKNKKFDIRKGCNALLPNTAHYIDSEIMYNVNEILINKGIPCYSIHDGFYTLIRYENEVKEAYRESYCNIFREDVLLNIIQNSFNVFIVNNEFKEVIQLLDIDMNSFDDFTNILEKKLKIKKKDLGHIKKNIHKNIIEICKNYYNILKEREIDHKILSDYVKTHYKNDEIIK